MPSLKDLRNRISSVKATQKITKAMQMVAAAKLRRAQTAAEASRPYADRMGGLVANLGRGLQGQATAPLYMRGTGRDRTHLLVVCTAERGLCGGFNSSIARLAREHVHALLAEGKDVKILCVGKKGYDILKRQFPDRVLDVIDFRSAKSIQFSHADTVAQRVFALFDEGAFDVCSLFFSRFKSVISQIPTRVQVLPVQAPEDLATSQSVYDYEPSQGHLLADLLPRYVKMQIFTALLENAASEQGARMSAMDSATRNAGEMIKKQTQKYNRTRQAMITKELIEIISGAEAL